MAFAALTFSFTSLTSCEDVPAPYEIPGGGDDNPSTPDVAPAGSGTQADPFNVAGALQYINNGGDENAEVYVKGKVVSVQSGSFDPSYGSLKYYISDDGTSTNQFLVYNGYAGPDRTKFTSEDALKPGDEVVICGKLVNYNGTKEFTTGNYVVSLNGNGNNPSQPGAGQPSGDGTQANPYNSVAANQYASSLASGAESDKDIYVKGKVVSVKEQYGTQYGNATFYISDDGKSDNQFYVFRALYLNNEKYTSGATLNPGDEVVVCGRVTNYMGNTPETVQGKAYLVSLKSNGGSEKPDTPDTPVSDALTIDGTTVTLANLAATPGTESVSLDCSSLGYTNAQEVETITFSDGTTLSFDKNGETNGPKYYDATKGFRIYKNNKLTFTGIKPIARIILTCDAYNGVEYVGNATATVAASGNSLVYTNVFTGTSGGGVQLRVKSIKIVYAK